MQRWSNAGLLLGQRRRGWANSKPTLGQRLMFAGITYATAAPIHAQNTPNHLFKGRMWAKLNFDTLLCKDKKAVSANLPI